jgi:ribosomal protein L21E
MPDDKKVRVKINPKIVDEHKREQKEGYKGTVEDYYEEFYGPVDLGLKKGGMTKSQKKVGKVMREFKAGKLHSGKKGPVVKSPKQAIAIALSEAGMSKKKMQSGGMVRGSGAAIRGTKFKGIF